VHKNKLNKHFFTTKMIMGASWLLHEYTAVNKITFEGEAAEEVWPNMLFQLV